MCLENECQTFNLFKNSVFKDIDFKSAIEKINPKGQGNFFGSFLNDRKDSVTNKFLFYFISLVIFFFIIHVSF